MEVMPSNFMPGDPRLIEEIVYELKSQGIFDQFRKECIADVDTKPAYQNLRQRVEGNVTSFLAKQKWTEGLNKNQLREQLRKHICESGWLERGVERIVDQVVNPKINSAFLPKVEDVCHTFLGIEKPHKEEEIKEGWQENVVNGDKPDKTSSVGLLPKDSEAISPESNRDANLHGVDARSVNIDGQSQGFSNNTAKTEEESPSFEPLDESSPKNENSVDSEMSGLTSHDSSLQQKPSTAVDIFRETLPNSCDTNISSNDSTRIKTYISEKKANEIKSVEKKIYERNNEVQKNAEESKTSENNESRIDYKEKKHEMRKSDKEDKKINHENDEKISKESHYRDKSSSKRYLKNKEKNEFKDFTRNQNDDSKPKGDSNKNDVFSRGKDTFKDHKDKDFKSSRVKTGKEKNKTYSDRFEKDKSIKEKGCFKRDDKDKHKGSSNRDKKSEKGKIKEKSTDDKERKHGKKAKKSESDTRKLSTEKSFLIKDLEKKSSSKNKEESFTNPKVSTEKVKTDKESYTSIESSEKHATKKDRDKDIPKITEPNKETKHLKDKSEVELEDSKDSDIKLKESEKHIKSNRGHKQKSSSSKKDKFKKSEDDHYGFKEKRNERRSTDRDSNDGSGINSFNDGNPRTSQSGKSSSDKLFDDSSSRDSSGGTSDNVEGDTKGVVEYIEEVKVFELKTVEHEIIQHTEDFEQELVIEPRQGEVVGKVEIVKEPEVELATHVVVQSIGEVQQLLPIKYIKPKFASNMKEALRIMKIRKQLAELEKQANNTLQNLSSEKNASKEKEIERKEQPEKNGLINTISFESNINLDNREAPTSTIKFIKPKFASNIQEAMRLMKIRKKLAKLEKEHQQALAELKKRKENSFQVEVQGVEEPSDKNQPSIISTQSTLKPEPKPKIELPDEEPLFQSFDLSSERFAELEARLALEMANIDFGSYDIASDEEEEYQSIVISPKKLKNEVTQDYKNVENLVQNDKSKDAKMVSKFKTKRSKSVWKKNTNNKVSDMKGKPAEKPIKLKNNVSIEKLHPKKKKLIIISCKQDLFNGFAEENTSAVSNSIMFSNFKNSKNIDDKEVRSSEKENSKMDNVNIESNLEFKENHSKILFVKVCRMEEIKKERIKSLEKIIESMPGAVQIINEAELNFEPNKTKEIKTQIEKLNNQMNESQISETLKIMEISRDFLNAPIAITNESNDVLNKVGEEKQNTKIIQSKSTKTVNSDRSVRTPDTDLWISEDTPCLYFLPPTDMKLNELTDLIDQLESKIKRDSLIISYDYGSKQKAGRKRKTERTANNIKMNVIMPEMKRKRLNLAEGKEIDNLILNASLSKRYDSSDLYKPRPVISRTSRRSLVAAAKNP